MRYVHLFAAAAVATLASGAAGQARVPNPSVLCGALGALAVTVMENRQDGVPRDDMLALAPEGTPDAPVFRSLIEDAYVVPRRADAAGRGLAVAAFRRHVEASCIAAIRGMA